VHLPGAPAILTVRSDEYLDELLREFELVRLGGRQGVLRSDYPQRLLAIIDEIVTRFSGARFAARDQAEAAMNRGEPTYTMELELPVVGAPALRQFLALMDEVEGFAEAGHLLTVPPADEVRRFQRWMVSSVVQALESGSDTDVKPFELGGSAEEEVERTESASLPDDAPSQLGGSRVARTTLPADLAAAGQARRFAHETLRAWSCLDSVLASVELPLSELVTNAVMHTRTDVEVVLRLGEGALRVEVYDGSPVLPSRRSHDMDAGTGRGLELVEALCERWGVEPGDGGKVVWFEVSATS
jgi:anti-sigma regulatory factor (Ser/Thr protein kinase)